MAEPLKNHFGERIPRAIARDIAQAWPAFDENAFVADVLTGYEPLELMDRGRHIAHALRRHLPDDFETSLALLMQAVRTGPGRSGFSGSMASFYYLPHVNFVAHYGLEYFDSSMQALYELTQRFTAEFSIRPFIERHERKSLALLRKWARDPNEHVRRLVSEGTRPRLPWAGRLRGFQENPQPVLALLELLKDDSALYVRRSVANNLNDIGKDHPDLLLDVAERWIEGASDERRALVRHALRSLIKAGNPRALAVLGFGAGAAVKISDVLITPSAATKGGKVTVSFTLRSTHATAQRILVDLRVFFVKANGASSPKVFKLKSLELMSKGAAAFRKTITLAELTTRKHFAGEHRVEVLVNGKTTPLGSFTVTLP